MHFAHLTFGFLSAWTIQLVLAHAADSKFNSMPRLKRSEEQSPVETIIQSLSQQLSESNARIAALEAKLKKLQQITSVAFFAEFTKDPIPLGPYAPLVFDVAPTNIGTGYNTLTGHFTAPVSGIYSFDVHYMGTLNSVVYVNMYVDNVLVDYSVSQSHDSIWAHVSESYVVQLNASQRVFLTNGEPHQREIRGGHWSTFSGFLIDTDP